MNPNNLLIQFGVELFRRLFTKSPKFFQVFQVISASGAVVTGLPRALNYLFASPAHPLPPWVMWFDNKPLAMLSTGVAIASFLTSASKPIAVNSVSGEVVKSTDAAALPFTTTMEQVSAEKKGVPSVTVFPTGDNKN